MGNFLTRYRHLADSWILFDNSGPTPTVVALESNKKIRIIGKEFYSALLKRYDRT